MADGGTGTDDWERGHRSQPPQSNQRSGWRVVAASHWGCSGRTSQPLDTLDDTEVLHELALEIMVSWVRVTLIRRPDERTHPLELPYGEVRLNLITPIRLCLMDLHDTERNTLDTSRHKL